VMMTVNAGACDPNTSCRISRLASSWLRGGHRIDIVNFSSERAHIGFGRGRRNTDRRVKSIHRALVFRVQRNVCGLGLR